MTPEQQKARQNAWAEMQEIRAAVDKNGWTPQRRDRWDELDAKIVDVGREADHDARSDAFSSGGVLPAGATGDMQGTRNDDGPVQFRKALGKDQRFRDLPGVGPVDNQAANNYWRTIAGEQVEERTAMGSQIGAIGGYTVPDSLAANVWDLVRNQLVFSKAGGTVIPLDGSFGEYSIPLQTKDAVPTWTAENTVGSEDDIEFGRATLTPKTLRTVVRISNELIQDTGVDLHSIVIGRTAKKFAEVLDRVTLIGSGVGLEPPGVITAWSGSVVGSSHSITYANLVTDAVSLDTINEHPTASVMSPRAAGQLGALVDTTGQPLRKPDYIADLPLLTTAGLSNSVVSNSTTDGSYVVTGDWSNAILGVRLAFTAKPLVELFASSNQTGFLMVMRADTALMRQSAFTVRYAGTAS